MRIETIRIHASPAYSIPARVLAAGAVAPAPAPGPTEALPATGGADPTAALLAVAVVLALRARRRLSGVTGA